MKGMTTMHTTQSAFAHPPMSSRRKMSTSAIAQIMARGRKIRNRKKVSQNVVATIAGLLDRGLAPDRLAAVVPQPHPVGMNVRSGHRPVVLDQEQLGDEWEVLEDIPPNARHSRNR